MNLCHKMTSACARVVALALLMTAVLGGCTEDPTESSSDSQPLDTNTGPDLRDTSVTCAGSEVLCGVVCVDLFEDNENCGDCGVMCARAESCERGECKLTCPDQQLSCGVDCVTPASNPLHCGACERACASDLFCHQGACVAGCPADATLCGQSCAELAIDPEHCGGCGVRCAYENAAAGCVGGSCYPAICHNGFKNCDAQPANGCEVDLLVDPSHCGDCNAACASGEVCSEGACAVACPQELETCNGGCVAPGTCPLPCEAPTVRCDGQCVDLNTAGEHCGRCGVSCAFAGGEAVCQDGDCVISACAGKTSDCDNDHATGCETDLTTTTDCGECEVSCGLAEGTAICTTNGCEITACGGLRADCDKDFLTGCEADLSVVGTCEVALFCRDGVVQAALGEACDDGNTSSADGCAANCEAVEPGWACDGEPSTCSQTRCAQDQRVQENACVACPPGTANLPGDSAAGPDTTCDPVFCADDERVINNACAPCPLGSTNLPGDDATGPDTTCDSDPCYQAFGVVCSDFAQAYIKASNTGAGDQLGHAIALDGDTLVVGAPYEDSASPGVGGDQANNTAADSGAVYVFTRSGTVWTQQAYIKASNPNADDWFGFSVAIEGDTLAVGAYGEDSSASGVGGDQADNATLESGAVYVFTRSGTTWTQQAYIKASNPDSSDTFGYKVALSGDTLAVGNHFEDSASPGIDGNQADNSEISSGAVYVFTRSGTTWTQEAYIKSFNPNGFDWFGFSVAVEGDTLVVGAHGEDSFATGVGGDPSNNSMNNSGAVYVFTRSGTAWTQQAYIKSSNTEEGDFFGYSVALSGDTLAVGALHEDSLATGIDGDQANNAAVSSGAVYVFTRSGTTWTQQAYLKASNAEAGDAFGFSLALEGDTLAVGASAEDSVATGVGGDQANNTAADSGAAYVFTRAGTTWTQQAYLKASNANSSDRFGRSIALRAGTLAVGASQEGSNATGIGGDQTNNAAANSGAVYIHKITP